MNIEFKRKLPTPEEIKAIFQCSKKDFKKALGYLFKQHLIDLTDKDCVRSVD